MSTDSTGAGEPNDFSVQVSGIVSTLLGSDRSAIVVAGNEIVRLIGSHSLDLLQELSSEQFNQLSDCPLEHLHVNRFFMLGFAIQMFVFGNRADEFFQKYFCGDLRAALDWVYRIGTGIERVLEPEDFIDSTWSKCIVLVGEICRGYRGASADRILTHQTGIAFLQRALRACKDEQYAALAIRNISLLVNRQTKTIDVFASVLTRAFAGDEISIEAQLFLFQYIRRGCAQPEDFLFILRRNFIDGLVMVLRKNTRAGLMMEVSNGEYMTEQDFRFGLIRELLSACSRHVSAIDAHDLYRALGDTILTSPTLLETLAVNNKGATIALVMQITLSCWDELILVTDDNVNYLLASTLMTMRLFVAIAALGLVDVPQFTSQFGCTQSVIGRQVLLRACKRITCFIPYAEQIDAATKQISLFGDSRAKIEQMTLIFKRALYAHRMVQVLVGLAALDLPALVTYEILEADTPTDDFTMYYKWRLITAVKHFR